MANNEMKAAVVASANNQNLEKAGTLSIIKSMVSNEAIKKKFEDLQGQKAPQFIASIVSLVSSSANFNGVDPNSIIHQAMIAAMLDLPINPSLGFAYIIPYNSKDGKKAQFQMSYRSFIQLALRSGQYKTINATEIYEGELVKRNRLTGEFEIDETKKSSEKVAGYAAHFKLLNGFEKSLYMTVEELQNHGKKFSKSYTNKDGLWQKDFHSMAMKTVIKMLLSKYGMLSVEMQKAVTVDQSVVNEAGEVLEYVDSPTGEVESSFEEVKELSPDEWENVDKVIDKLKTFNTWTDCNAFLTKNTSKLDSFGGQDADKLNAVVSELSKCLVK